MLNTKFHTDPSSDSAVEYTSIIAPKMNTFCIVSRISVVLLRHTASVVCGFESVRIIGDALQLHICLILRSTEF